MMNPMITLANPYDSWLTLNSKWLPSKPAEITLIGQWAQYWPYTPHIPAILVSKPMFFWMKNPMITLQNPYVHVLPYRVQYTGVQ